jgi:hypothetical protein
MIGRLRVGAAWSAIPMQVMTADTISDHLRPYLSAKGQACVMGYVSADVFAVNYLLAWFLTDGMWVVLTTMDAIKQPACSVDTTRPLD